MYLIYDITCLDHYESFNVVGSDFELVSQYERIERLKEEWGIKELKRSYRGKKADIAYNWSFLSMILSQKAYDMLKDIFLEEEVEMLPVVCDGETYYIPHGIKAESNLQIVIQKRGNKPHYKYFNEEELNKIEVDKKYFFRVAGINGKASIMFFTQKFINLVRECGLKGIEFDEVGETEQEEVMNRRKCTK